MKMMSLRELCESLGVSRRSVQCYEQAGLLMATDKNKYGHLLYDENAFQRAKKIRFLQQVGFKLREIKELIDAPKNVMKEALERRVRELQVESGKIQQIITEAKLYLEGLE